MPRLRRVSPASPGLTRVRRGKGFRYLDAGGRPVSDEATLARVEALVIPPAWTDVWICPVANGHIQATGLDAAGRRQYRYHDAWRLARDLDKHERVLDFAAALPAVREQVCADLGADGLSRRRVLSCAVRLLDLGFFRIGSEQYAARNQTFGLATMRKEHVTVAKGVVTFDYVAKSGKHRVQSLVEPEVAAVVQALKRRRGGGAELLAFRDGGRWVDVRSSDINDHLRALSGGAFTAKDFRTWSATVLAAVGLAVSTEAAASVTARKRAVTRVVQEVAHYLGNTPAVCRASYIDPRVIDLYESGVTVRSDLRLLGDGVSYGQPATQGAVEAAVLRLLRAPAARVQVA
ncbi:MAG: DNA topoisomerase IB [Mycobacteriales bacterium]